MCNNNNNSNNVSSNRNGVRPGPLAMLPQIWNTFYQTLALRLLTDKAWNIDWQGEIRSYHTYSCLNATLCITNPVSTALEMNSDLRRDSRLCWAQE
jgi:hypothetical protein